MTSNDFYRLNAEDCLRKAADDDAGKPLWATLARSWLKLAEHASRMSEQTARETPTQVLETTDAPSTNN
jgi:hypothetical protein